MRISERITATVEDWRKAWGEALKSFLVTILSFGLEVFLNIIGKAAAPKLKPLVDMIEATGKVPPELRPLLDEIKEPKGQVGAMFAQSAGSALVGGAIGKIIDAILLPLAYAANSVTRNVELSEIQMLALWLRNEWSPEELDKKLSWLGVPTDNVENLKKLTQVRFDPGSWIAAFRRKYKDFSKIKDDLKHQGWDDDRIEALKFVTLYYPSPAELVHWTAREVFEPDKIKKYGLMADADKLRREDFYKAGMDDEQINNHWIAHWEHASFIQVIEMLHRGIIKEQDVKDWFPLVEVAPFWAENLIKIAYTWPTRVDVRRWWDMRTIDEARLKELYEGMGYRGKNLEDYIKWTKVYTDFPMMIARFTKGWITERQVFDWLIEQGIPNERARHFIEEKVKPEAPERVADEIKLTKAEIVKGVKKGVIDWSQGVELLQALGLAKWEAEFKLEIDVGVLEGSPDTYMEFKKWTELYKQSQGLPAKIPPLELIQAERDVTQAEATLKEAKAKNAKGTELQEMERAVEAAKILYHQLLTQYTKGS